MYIKKEKNMATQIKFPTVIILLFCIFLIDVPKADVVVIEDGRYHLINNSMYQKDFVRLDYNVIKSPGTHLELIEGGIIDNVYAYHNSSIVVNGGSIGWRINLYDKSTATINDGLLGGVWSGYESSLQISGGTITTDLESMGNAAVSIYGGVIKGDVEAWYDCTTKIYGGTIGDQLEVFGNGKIYLYGSGFSVGGRYLNSGDSLRDYGTSIGYALTGIIRGKLQDGSDLNSAFYISGLNTNCDIIVIPEPTTLLLLSLGGLLLRRKK